MYYKPSTTNKDTECGSVAEAINNFVIRFVMNYNSYFHASLKRRAMAIPCLKV